MCAKNLFFCSGSFHTVFLLILFEKQKQTPKLLVFLLFSRTQPDDVLQGVQIDFKRSNKAKAILTGFGAGFPGSVHGHLDGLRVGGHLGRRGGHGDRQGEAFAWGEERISNKIACYSLQF